MSSQSVLEHDLTTTVRTPAFRSQQNAARNVGHEPLTVEEQAHAARTVGYRRLTSETAARELGRPVQSIEGFFRTVHGARLLAYERISAVQINSVSIAQHTLDNVMTDPLAPAGARVTAARIVLQIGGILRPIGAPLDQAYGPPDAHQPSATAEQLAPLLASVQSSIADMRRMLEQSAPLDVTPTDPLADL